jgi:hypothetical protein
MFIQIKPTPYQPFNFKMTARHSIKRVKVDKVKVKLSRYMPWRNMGGEEV